MEFGETVRQARLRSGLTQSELARQLVTSGRPDGVWPTYVGQIEKGIKVPSEEICLKLAEVLGLDPLPLLVRAHRDRAGSGPAVAFLTRLFEATTMPGAMGLVGRTAAKDGEEAERLEVYERILALMEDDALTAVLPLLCRAGLAGQLCVLLEDLEQIGEAEWNRLDSLLGDLAMQGKR